MADVSTASVRSYRTENGIAAPWTEVVSTPDQHGYAVTITADGESTEHIILAGDIAEAAASAVSAASARGLAGEITAIRHLGPALR